MEGDWLERVGKLAPDGSCPITMSTVEGDAQVVCVALDHAHCTGCYRAIDKRRIWCSHGCSEMVTEYDWRDWSKAKRHWRAIKALRDAYAHFVKTYGVRPERLYVSGTAERWVGERWLAKVRNIYPDLRMIRMPATEPTVGRYGILFATDRRKAICLSVVRIPTMRGEAK